MANCSIPNSTPATGRTSTRSLRRSKRESSGVPQRAAFRLTRIAWPWERRSFNAQRSRPNAQRSIQIVGRWKLDVGSWTFSCSGRVKGAWWPSRSSKPSSPRKWRGRFDSYPLRLDFSTLNAQRPTLNAQFRQLGIGRWTLSVGRFLLLNSKGGEPHVA
jgi:hypothetical protein